MAEDNSTERESCMPAGCLPHSITSGFKRLLLSSRSRTPILTEDVLLLEEHLREDKSQRGRQQQRLGSEGLKHAKGVSLPNLTDLSKELPEKDDSFVQKSSRCLLQSSEILVKDHSNFTHLKSSINGNSTYVSSSNRVCGDALSMPARPALHQPINRSDALSMHASPALCTPVIRSGDVLSMPASPPSHQPVNRLLSTGTDYGDSGYSTPSVIYETLPVFSYRNKCIIPEESEGIYENLPVILRNKESKEEQNNSHNENLPSDFANELLQGPAQTLVTEMMFNDISEDIACGESWKKLGHYMFPNYVVQNIDSDNRSSREKAYQLLIRWQQENGRKATVQQLVTILKKADRVDIADKLLKLSKKAWRQSLEVIEEQGRQSELVNLLQHHLKTLQDNLDQQHNSTQKTLQEMYQFVKERDVVHKATELELQELQKQLYSAQNQEVKLLPKRVETLLERMHGVEEALKHEKEGKNKKGRDYAGDSDDEQSQCMFGFVNTIKRRLPSTSSGKKKSYTPSKKVTETDSKTSRQMRQSYIFALDDPLPYDKPPTDPPMHMGSGYQPSSQNTFKPPPPPYRPPHRFPHSETVPHNLGEACYNDQTLHRCCTAPSRLETHPQEGKEFVNTTPLEGGDESQEKSSVNMMEWMKDLDEHRDAVTV